ncbi:succinylglutamate desuccinylase/aspartoacylase family protein [Brevibacillus panacihumi]|uniref:succinylglutamate desuccinylase/aspartoacylase family protein n=1 Tax=Paenibacillaceae TaxID=186822 RepID=UPI003D08D1EE
MREVQFEPTSLTQFSVFEFGDGQGPSIAITAGIHGEEQTAIHVANLLVKWFMEKPLKGRMKIIPLCNPAAYRHRTRCSPFDGLDLNRVFPGSAEGSPTLQLAHALWKETRDVEYILDLHCCGAYGSVYTVALHEQYPHQRDLAKALGIPTVIHSGGASGQLFLEANRAGQKALLIELPGGQPDGMINLRAAEECFQTVLKYLCHLGMVEGETNSSPVHFYGKITTLTAPSPGLFLPIAKAGESCQEGEILGTYNGSPVKAPFDGVITAICPPRYSFAGERMVRLSPILLC